jgi:hypothetical protein
MVLDPLMPGLFDEVAAESARALAELQQLLDERPDIKAAADQAKELFEARNHEFQSMQIRVARATRHGADSLTAAVARRLDQRRCDRDSAGGAMTRTKQELENCDWRIGSLRAELTQLDLVANPPNQDGGPRVELITRPKPPFHAGDFEVIEMPTARTAATAS